MVSKLTWNRKTEESLNGIHWIHSGHRSQGAGPGQDHGLKIVISFPKLINLPS